MIQMNFKIKKMKKYNYLLLIFVINCFTLNGQIDQAELSQSLVVNTRIVARPHADSVELFWTVDKPVAWLLANREGYVIERAVVNSNTSNFQNLEYAPIGGSPFKPWTRSQFESYFGTHDEEDIGAEQVYFSGILLKVIEENDLSANDYPNPFGNGLNSLSEGKNSLDVQFGFSMLLATQARDAAYALGVRTTDVNVKSGATYVYRIRLKNNPGNYIVEENFTKVTVQPFDKNQYTTKLFSKEGDQEILLKWESNQFFSAYQVYRSTTENGPYEKITKVPLLNSKPANYRGEDFMGFAEDSLSNNQDYYYQVMGNSPFADEMLIGTIKLRPKDLTPPQKPILKLPKNSSPNEVALTWTMPPSNNNDLKGFMIGRSQKIDGPFEKINNQVLDPNTRTYIDENFIKGSQNYYVVQAIDYSDNVNTSMVALVTLVDSIPPNQPEILSGTIDTSGIVTLTLAANRELDLMGYRILKANSKDHEYSLFYESFSDNLSRLDTIYYDTLALNTLTKHAYYKVIALDEHFNLSLASLPFKITRPDTIPPVTPLFEAYLTTEQYIQLSIIPSSSPDVMAMQLYRKEEGTAAAFKLHQELSPSRNSYTDTTVLNNVTYAYQLRAIDESGNLSPFSNPLLAKTYPMNYLLPVENLSLSYDDVNQKMQLNWDYSDKREEINYQIFKKGKSQKWKKVGSVKGSENLSFTESEKEQDIFSLVYKVKVYSKRKESVGDKEVKLN